MTLATRPLFRVDPGWLFILAGLTVCAAGVILPAQGDLDALRRQLTKLQSEETRALARLKAHADFLDQVDQDDPALIKRLAATQLNLVPEGDIPILLANTQTSPVTDWIDSTVRADIRPSKPVTLSTLSRLANGPYRLWLFGGGIMSVFVGLIITPGPIRLLRARPAISDMASVGVATLDEPDDSSYALEPLGAEDELGQEHVQLGPYSDVIELPVTVIEPKPQAPSNSPPLIESQPVPESVLEAATAALGDATAALEVTPAETYNLESTTGTIAAPQSTDIESTDHDAVGQESIFQNSLDLLDALESPTIAASDPDECHGVIQHDAQGNPLYQIEPLTAEESGLFDVDELVDASARSEPFETDDEASDDPTPSPILKLAEDDGDTLDAADSGIDDEDDGEIDFGEEDNGYQIESGEDDAGDDDRRPPFDGPMFKR